LRRGALAAVRITPQGHYKHWQAVVHPHLAEADYIREFIGLVAMHAPCNRPALRIASSVGGRRRVAQFASSS